MKRNKATTISVMALTFVGGLLTVAFNQTRSPTSAPAADPEAAYSQTLDKRAQEILDALSLSDPGQKARVRAAVVAQYRALRDWHDQNDAKLKALSKDSSANADQIAQIKSTLKVVHDQYLAQLAGDGLDQKQIDIVKDKMTYGTVQVTYNAYCDMLAKLTDVQKAKIMELLVQAREEAMDDGSSDEKHATFGRYKGKINNYLSKEGYDVAKESREWQARVKQQQGN
jgi:Spy/CpxP family protein refolding chaperone